MSERYFLDCPYPHDPRASWCDKCRVYSNKRVWRPLRQFNGENRWYKWQCVWAPDSNAFAFFWRSFRSEQQMNDWLEKERLKDDFRVGNGPWI